jgi:ABC-type cobalamin/Fe3+-siderophores transport system ATPase subunit
VTLLLQSIEVDARLHCTSLHFHNPALVMVIGENNAGKSTLLDVCAGVLAPTAGSVVLDGIDLAQLSPRLRARMISSLGQAEAHTAHLSVRERIAVGVAADVDVQVETVAQTLALHELLDTPMARLSLGTRRRAGVARALVDQRTRVVTLDEPLAGIDVVQQRRVLSAMRERTTQGSGAVVLFSCHDLLHLQWVDRVIAVAGGSVVLDAQKGSPDFHLDQLLRAAFAHLNRE